MSYIFRNIIKKSHMRQCPKYTRAKEEGRQRSGSLISTFLMHCYRPRELVSAASGDELFLVLKMLLESIHGFLHQPSTLDAQHGILVHKFLNNELVLFNKAVVSSCCSALPMIFALSMSRSAWSFSLLSLSCRMMQIACSNEAFMSSYNLAQPEI